jgi:recombination protein RecR
VVEEVTNLFALERGGNYRGLYHVLHGVLSPLDGVGPEELRIESLMKRLEAGGIQELILALNPTLEGENTSRYISLLAENKGIRITRIASGVPVGGDLEFVDDLTLSRSLSGRQDFGKPR